MLIESKIPKTVYLRPLVVGDLSFLLRLRNENRQSFLNKAEISYPDHIKWFYGYYMNSLYDTIYTIHDVDNPDVKVGIISLTLQPSIYGHTVAEAGRVMIDKKGEGYGYAALNKIIELARDIYRLSTLNAVVLNNNTPSRRLFEKCKFGCIGYHGTEAYLYNLNLR